MRLITDRKSLVGPDEGNLRSIFVNISIMLGDIIVYASIPHCCRLHRNQLLVKGRGSKQRLRLPFLFCSNESYVINKL